MFMEKLKIIVSNNFVLPFISLKELSLSKEDIDSLQDKEEIILLLQLNKTKKENDYILRSDSFDQIKNNLVNECGVLGIFRKVKTIKSENKFHIKIVLKNKIVINDIEKEKDFYFVTSYKNIRGNKEYDLNVIHDNYFNFYNNEFTLFKRKEVDGENFSDSLAPSVSKFYKIINNYIDKFWKVLKSPSDFIDTFRVTNDRLKGIFKLDDDDFYNSFYRILSKKISLFDNAKYFFEESRLNLLRYLFNDYISTTLEEGEMLYFQFENNCMYKKLICGIEKSGVKNKETDTDSFFEEIENSINEQIQNKEEKTSDDKNKKEEITLDSLESFFGIKKSSDIPPEKTKYIKQINSFCRDCDYKKFVNLPVEDLREIEASIKSIDDRNDDVLKNYLKRLPFCKNEENKLAFNFENAKKELDKSIEGLEEAKNSILKFALAKQINPFNDDRYICLVGNPGIGKTSLVKEVANAIGYEYSFISLAGLATSFILLGTERSYKNSKPGLIIDAIATKGSNKIVIVLDEIDKIGHDNNYGDIENSLIRLFDPTLGFKLYDEYLQFSYDYKDVIFICTANNIHNVSSPLRNRLKIINLDDYLLDEKISIAKNKIIPRIAESLFLDSNKVNISEEVISYIINNLTFEGGVRRLSNKLHDLILDKLVLLIKEDQENKNDIKDNKKYEITIDMDFVKSHTKQSEQIYLPKLSQNIGISNGVAYFTLLEGGSDSEIIQFESIFVKKDNVERENNNNSLVINGNVQQLMKESILTAYYFLKSHKNELNINDFKFDDYELYFNVINTSGVKVDGGSAGSAICLSLLSYIYKKEIPISKVFSGMITLNGEIKEVGGIKTKLIGLKKYGFIKDVYLSINNKKDVEIIPSNYIEGLNIHYVSNMIELAKKIFS